MTFVEFENGVVRVRRLRVEDVQAGTGNPAFLQDFGQGSLVDHWAARAVDQKGRRLHQSEPPGIDEMPRLLRQRAIDGNEIRLAKDRIQIDEPDPEFGSKPRIDVGIVRDEMHVERLGEAENLCSDVADADRSEPTRPIPL